MVHTPEIYIQQESVSAYITHSNNAKTNFPQTTNKQSPHRIENKGSGKKYLSGDEEWEEDREHQKQARSRHLFCCCCCYCCCRCCSPTTTRSTLVWRVRVRCCSIGLGCSFRGYAGATTSVRVFRWPVLPQ